MPDAKPAPLALTMVSPDLFERFFRESCEDRYAEFLALPLSAQQTLREYAETALLQTATLAHCLLLQTLIVTGAIKRNKESLQDLFGPTREVAA